MNAGRNNDSSNFNLGFGATLAQGVSGVGNAADLSSALFTATTGTHWTGNYFSHDYIIGAGLHSVITGSPGKSVLSEASWGNGFVMLGGMTTNNFHSPSAAAAALRAGILSYDAAHALALKPADLYVGTDGHGMLNVQSGGYVHAGTSFLSVNAGSVGNAVISGIGSSWIMDQNLYIGGSTSLAGGMGNLTITGGGRVDVGGLTKVWAGHGAVTIGAGGTLATGSLDGDVTNNGSLVIGGVNSSSTYNGVISGVGEVHKVGSGLVTFGGSNTYSGGTYVDGGTLRFASAAPSGPLHVANGASVESAGGSLYINDLFVNDGTVNATVDLQNGALVKGSGSFDGLVVNTGATVAPGHSPGTLDSGTTTWNGGTYLWEINTLAGDGGTAGQNPGWDLWNTGLLSINGAFVISVNSLTTGNVAGALANWNPNLEQDWLIATATNGAFSSLGFLSLDTSPFAAYNALGGGVFSLLSGAGGNELHLHYAAVPEPSSLILGGVLAVGIYRRHRRRRNPSDTQARTLG